MLRKKKLEIIPIQPQLHLLDPQQEEGYNYYKDHQIEDNQIKDYRNEGHSS
jgi:hypothetical protein